jgi:hypothetical protein
LTHYSSLLVLSDLWAVLLVFAIKRKAFARRVEGAVGVSKAPLGETGLKLMELGFLAR